MKAKKNSRRRYAALMAALTLPFILNFAAGEAAPEVTQPFETSETAPPADVEVVDENSKDAD